MVHQRRRAVIVCLSSICITLALLAAAVPLGMVGVQRRIINPPTFALHFGNIEIAAPCPTRVFVCPQPLPWYAIWWSENRPDGGMRSRQLYFMYLGSRRSP